MNEIQSAPVPNPKKSSVRKIILIVLGVLILLLVSFYFIGKNQLGKQSKQAQQLEDQAWNKLYNGDYDGSIADFKQVHVLDPKRGNPNTPEFYWALGVILGKRNDYDGSIKVLSKGMEIDPQNTRTICTLAYSYVNKYTINPKQNMSSLDTAISLFKKADAINPNDANCHYFWSFAEYYKGNYAESWKHVIKMEQQGAIMDENFLEDLSKKMPRPK